MAEIKGKITPDKYISTSFENKDEIKSNVAINNEVNATLNNKNTIKEKVETAVEVELNKISNVDNFKANFDGRIHTGYGYVHIRYSHSRPTSDEELLIVPDELTYYIGIYSGFDASPPSSYTAYTWAQFRGNEGEQGPQGETGPKGDSGETKLIVINPLHFKGVLNQDKWIVDISRDSAIYTQVIEITNQSLISSTITQEQLIEYMNIKMTDRVTPLIDVLLSNTVELGIKQLEEWKNISKAYITRENVLVDGVETQKYYLHFECYKQAPNIQLEYQVKVI